MVTVIPLKHNVPGSLLATGDIFSLKIIDIPAQRLHGGAEGAGLLLFYYFLFASAFSIASVLSAKIFVASSQKPSGRAMRRAF